MDSYQHIQSGVLTAALPYIQRYYKKTIVIKYGGNAMTEPALMDAVMSDIILLSLVGIRVVLVHGGGPEISEMLKRVGKETKFINGLRQTDEETMDIVQMVLCGKINKNLVSKIETQGGKAVGLCGLDGSMILAKKLPGDYGFVGEITRIDPAPINTVLEAGCIPVIASVGRGEDGGSYNLNADTAAAHIASATGAVKLLLLTDVIGVLKDVKDSSSLIAHIKAEEIKGLIKDGVISGGMIPKIECCLMALSGGVERTHIIDGRVPHSILIELLSDEGVGTMID